VIIVSPFSLLKGRIDMVELLKNMGTWLQVKSLLLMEMKETVIQ